ncbi:MAG: phosphatidylglycerophosphatase A [Williamsia sp.]|nr:phosphatidylglycerophosphatase A [Williamsia sp.]
MGRTGGMMRVHAMICACLGIGYLKGGGSYAALVFVMIRYMTRTAGNSIAVQLAVFGLISVVGVWSSSKMEAVWGKDSSKVVIDEVAGMSLTVLFVPPTAPYLITGFVLFRFFDIVKPLYLRRLEKIPGGWGVMLDDLGAGLFAHLVLSVTIASHLY